MGAPLRLCSLCSNRMQLHETFDCCLDCKSDRMKIEMILRQIRTVYPDTQRISLLEIVTRLWEFRWKHRKLS